MGAAQPRHYQEAGMRWHRKKRYITEKTQGSQKEVRPALKRKRLLALERCLQALLNPGLINLQLVLVVPEGFL